MDGNTKAFVSFLVAILCNSALANENEECDCEILQLHFIEDPIKINYYNFTRQNQYLIGGKPTYFSLTKNIHNIIWWNKTENVWNGNSYKLNSVAAQLFPYPYPKTFCKSNDSNWLSLNVQGLRDDGYDINDHGHEKKNFYVYFS